MNRELKIINQSVDTYAHLPKIRHPDGGRRHVDDADLWFASKINATLKATSASDIYWDKKLLPQDKQVNFIKGVRNHSWNRQHMGAMIVGGVDLEVVCSSLVSSCFVLGKFYRMQQQTRRSVILDEVVSTPLIDKNDEVKASFESRFDLYWDIVDKRPEKFKGFDPYIQDAFKVLPLSTKTRFAGNLDLRTVKGYTRWRKFDYLPTAVRDFAEKLYNSATEEYPIMFKSYLFDSQNKDEEKYKLHLKMANKIGSTDLMEEPMLWYSDHSFLLPKNHYFEKLYSDYTLETQFDKAGPDALMVGYFNPLGLTLNDISELFLNKDEGAKAALELTSITFASKIDLSGAIDTWRHTRNNRMVQPIYHALANSPTICMPELHRRQLEHGNSEIPEKFMEVSADAIKLYSKLVKDGIEAKEAINVLPHNLELIQVEMMDLFSFLNIMAIRTCIHARPEVQIWAKSLLREIAITSDFRGMDQMSTEQSNLLARGIVFGYCAELGTCTKCGPDVVYLPDPFRE